MSAGNISIYVTKADTARLEELGLEPKAWVRDTIKSALKELALIDALERPLGEVTLAEVEAAGEVIVTDEENQALEESVGEPSELPEYEAVPRDPADDNSDWVARLRNRAYPDGVPE